MHYYIAAWKQREEPGIGLCWVAPEGGEVVVDLREQADAAGNGFFRGATVPEGAVAIAEDGVLIPGAVADWNQRLGVKVDADTLRRLVEETINVRRVEKL